MDIIIICLLSILYYASTYFLTNSRSLAPTLTGAMDFGLHVHLHPVGRKQLTERKTLHLLQLP